MALNHVCIWDPKVGYRRVTIREACKIHPFGASAESGYFVCELCAQNVLLTQPGLVVQHFRHNPAEPNKECDERHKHFDPTYGRAINGLNSHVMPLRISVHNTNLSLELGFFSPPNRNARCDRIRISTDSQDAFEYSFERIESVGTTYLNVGSVPSRSYTIEYVNATAELKKFWSDKVQGIHLTGSFFDGRTRQLLQQGGKAYAGNQYYLLQKGWLSSVPSDIEATEMAIKTGSQLTSWHLYRIRVRRFSELAAKFFLRYAIFLTEKPTEFYPIWPAYVADPYFIYHNSEECYFYLCGDDAELKSYPPTSNVRKVQDGKLYRLFTQRREQLISIGKSGALGFSYLIKQPLKKEAKLPSVTITDTTGNELNEDTYSKLPISKIISVSCQYDGRAVVQRKDKTEYVYRMSADQDLQIDGLSFGTEIHFYQGCDCVRTIRFEQKKANDTVLISDDVLVKKLKTCSGPMIPVTHAIGTLAGKYSAYPKTKQWLYTVLRHGEIPRDAYRILLNSTNSTKD